jgi:hypothetical protein
LMLEFQPAGRICYEKTSNAIEDPNRIRA